MTDQIEPLDYSKTVDDLLTECSFDKTFITQYPYPYFVDSLRLSHSTLATLDSCPRKFEFTKLYQNPKHSDSLAADFGSAIHIGFQEYLTSHNYTNAVWKMMLAYPWELGESSMKDRSAEGAIALLDKMIEVFPETEWELAWLTVEDGTKIPCTEVSFSLTFEDWPSLTQLPLDSQSTIKPKSIDLTYVGFMDLVLHHKFNDTFMVVDIKTTSDKLEDQTPKYKYTDQCVPYGLVLNALLGIGYDELEVGYYVANPSILEPKVRFFSFYKSSKDLADWAKGMQIKLSLLSQCTKSHWFPRTHNGCVSFNRVCPFYDYCSDRDPTRTQLQLAYQGERELPQAIEPMVSLEINLGELASANAECGGLQNG